MAKKRPIDRSKQAAQRQAAALERARDSARRVQAEIVAAEDHLREARALRDVHLRALLVAGESWSSLSRLTGLTRQALHERFPDLRAARQGPTGDPLF